MSVAESVHYPWERALTVPNKVPYYVKYAYVFFISEKPFNLYNHNCILL